MSKPTDVPGECNAHLYIGDDFGDNSASMRCSLAAGHDGKHRETWGEGCTVEWVQDQREPPCEHEITREYLWTDSCAKCSYYESGSGTPPATVRVDELRRMLEGWEPGDRVANCVPDLAALIAAAEGAGQQQGESNVPGS